MQAKLDTPRVFSNHRIFLAVAEHVRDALPDLPQVIPFKSALTLKDVLARLETVV